MATVHVLAIITAKPSRRAELLAAFQADVPNVHAEDGCLEYVFWFKQIPVSAG
jgi:quinol monooxygenase YgiN